MRGKRWTYKLVRDRAQRNISEGILDSNSKDTLIFILGKTIFFFKSLKRNSLCLTFLLEKESQEKFNIQLLLEKLS